MWRRSGRVLAALALAALTVLSAEAGTSWADPPAPQGALFGHYWHVDSVVITEGTWAPSGTVTITTDTALHVAISGWAQPCYVIPGTTALVGPWLPSLGLDDSSAAQGWIFDSGTSDACTTSATIPDAAFRILWTDTPFTYPSPSPSPSASPSDSSSPSPSPTPSDTGSPAPTSGTRALDEGQYAGICALLGVGLLLLTADLVVRHSGKQRV